MFTRIRALMLSIGLCVITAGAAGAQPVTIATNPQGSLAYASGAAIAKAITNSTDMQARVVPQGGPSSTIPIMLDGEFDFVFATAVEANFAYKGEEDYSQPAKTLRIAANLFPLRFGLAVRADSGIRTVADLKGKRVAAGLQQQRNLGAALETYLAAAGLSYDDVVPVMAPSGPKGIDDFVAGNADAAIFSLGSGAMKEADASVGGIRYLPFPPGAVAETALAKLAGAKRMTVEPNANLEGIDQPIEIIYSPFTILTSAKTDEKTVAALVRTLIDDKPELVGSVGAFAAIDAMTIGLDVGVPLHPATMKILAEKGGSN